MWRGKLNYYIVDLAQYPFVNNLILSKKLKVFYLFSFFKKESILKVSPIVLDEDGFNELENIEDYIVVTTSKRFEEVCSFLIEKLFFISNNKKHIFRFYDPKVFLSFINFLNNRQKSIFFKNIDFFSVKYNKKSICYSLVDRLVVDRDTILLSSNQILEVEEERMKYIKIDFYKKQKIYFNNSFYEVNQYLDYFFSINIYNFYEIGRVLELIKMKIIDLDSLINNEIFNFMYDEKVPESIRVNQIYIILGLEY